MLWGSGQCLPLDCDMSFSCPTLLVISLLTYFFFSRWLLSSWLWCIVTWIYLLAKILCQMVLKEEKFTIHSQWLFFRWEIFYTWSMYRIFYCYGITNRIQQSDRMDFNSYHGYAKWAVMFSDNMLIFQHKVLQNLVREGLKYVCCFYAGMIRISCREMM